METTKEEISLKIEEYGKMAKESFDVMIEDGEDVDDYKLGYINGCLRVWGNEVIPLKERINKLELELDNLADPIEYPE